jgi:hypothetical protein
MKIKRVLGVAAIVAAVIAVIRAFYPLLSLNCPDQKRRSGAARKNF